MRLYVDLEFFPILIVTKPIIDPKSGTGIWLSNQKYYFIYFYNE